MGNICACTKFRVDKKFSKLLSGDLMRVIMVPCTPEKYIRPGIGYGSVSITWRILDQLDCYKAKEKENGETEKLGRGSMKISVEVQKSDKRYWLGKTSFIFCLKVLVWCVRLQDFKPPNLAFGCDSEKDNRKKILFESFLIFFIPCCLQAQSHCGGSQPHIKAERGGIRVKKDEESLFCRRSICLSYEREIEKRQKKCWEI